MSYHLHVNRKRLRFIISMGIVVSLLLFAAAGLLYYQGQTVRSEKLNRPECQKSQQSTLEGRIVVQEADLSCQVERSEKNLHAKRLEGYAVVLTASGSFASLAVLMLARQKTTQSKKEKGK